MIVYWNYFGQLAPYTFSHIIKSSYVIFIFLMGFYGLKQGDIFTEKKYSIKNTEAVNFTYCQENKKKENKKENTQGDISLEKYKNSLLKYIIEKKPYLNSNLKLLDIAIKLDIPPHILSNVINLKLQKNYFYLINTFRIEDAKKMLVNPVYKNYTILAIAYDCGFNSKSSFNRVFKMQAGMTPSLYQKKNIS